MADDKKLKLELQATGGAAAAKEVGKVEQAVSDLATESKKLPSNLVPAWDQTSKAVEGAGEAIETAAVSTKELDSALGDAKSRIEEARAKIEEFRKSTEEASGDDGGGGIEGMVGKFGPLIAQVTLVVGVINGLVQVLNRVDAAGEEAANRAADLGDAYGKALGENDADRDALARSLEKTITPASTLADELGRLADNNEFANDAARDTAALANSAAEAFDAYKLSLIDLKVARGEMTKEEAAVAKGELETGKVLREVEERAAAAAAERATASKEYQAALEAERQATVKLAEAGDAVQSAGGRDRERIFNAGQMATNAGIIGGLSPFDPTAASQTIDLAGGEEAVRSMIEEMEGAAAYAAKVKLALGASVESVLGAGERSEISRMMSEEAEAEMTAAETNLKKSQETAAKIQEEREKELIAVRKIREAAEARERQAQFDQTKVEAERKIAEELTVPTIGNRTQAELAQLEAKRREEEARAADKARKEQERADRERQAAEMQRQRDEINAQAMAAADPLDARAQRMGAAGLDDKLVSKAASIAQGLSDGVTLPETQRGLAAIDGIIDRLPAALQAQAQQAVAPLEAKLRQFEQMLVKLESQSRNNPSR